MRVRTAVLVLAGLLVGLPSPVSAQRVSAFERLPEVLDVGDRVVVTDTSGQTTAGRVERLTVDVIALRTSRSTAVFPQAAVRQVARRRPLAGEVAKGAAAFAAIGAAIGVAFIAADGSGTQTRAVDVLGPAAALAVVGAGIAAATGLVFPASTVVFVAPTASRTGQPSVVLAYRRRW